ncbi:thioredoxin family protein [Microcoleus sp. LEGE 07076]|uniref:thioredoxin family protein n=1 Tax=Microcoleus sp. LEGE 07076 TaxID=915322 RepID=UPI00187E8911|nr:thioredoxin family protein [Microcoleus sp. LEGE 07076]MBE9184593.1 thioredoxin family protein [Microcoleus sp. LEGE 07076]
MSSIIETTGTPINGYAPDFELPGVDQEVHHLARYLEKFRAIGVVFMCNHCPYVHLYLDRLKKLQADFDDRAVTLIGINANDCNQHPDDSFEKMKIFAADNQLNFPYIRDVAQDVAQSFGASKTPEVFLLDKDGRLRYRGLIDDNADDAAAVQVSYLQSAIDQLLKDEPVEPSITEAIGCSVKWRL